jgi:hypothetical protein
MCFYFLFDDEARLAVPPRFKTWFDDFPAPAFSPGHTGRKLAAMSKSPDHVNAVAGHGCGIFGTDNEVAVAHAASSPLSFSTKSTRT